MTVFANGREISSEAQGCKVIACFPDVCFTPPENPATPPGVPVPYPNFGFDSDLTSGSGTVKIGNKPISQENSSYYKKCSGDEAGAAAKKGVITSKNTGKVHARAWSSDVKVEGKGVARLGDMATTNHASDPPDAGTMAIVATADAGDEADVKCLVGSYDEIKKACGKQGGQAHHIVPDKVFRTGNRASAEAGAATVTRTFGTVKARINNAPSFGGGICICLQPKDHQAIHALERNSLSTLGPNGTANVKAISGECSQSLDDMEKEDGTQPDGECIKDAKKKVKAQTDKFTDGQCGRTSNAMPDAAGCARMGCPVIP